MSIASPHDIYVKHTGKNGSSHVQTHRVWDAERFMAERAAEAQKEGGKAAVQQLTKEQFVAFKK